MNTCRGGAIHISRRRDGFTLAELLVVTVIIGLALLFVMPRFESIVNANAESRSLRMISSIVTQAQDLAVLKNEPVEAVFDLDGHTLSIPSLNKQVSWPESVGVTVRTELTDGFVRSGRVIFHVSEYGVPEPLELKIGSTIGAKLNPFTGVLDVRTR